MASKKPTAMRESHAILVQRAKLCYLWPLPRGEYEVHQTKSSSKLQGTSSTQIFGGTPWQFIWVHWEACCSDKEIWSNYITPKSSRCLLGIMKKCRLCYLWLSVYTLGLNESLFFSDEMKFWWHWQEVVAAQSSAHCLAQSFYQSLVWVNVSA